MRITIEATKLQRQLDEARRNAIDLGPALEDIGEEWLISISQNFDAEGRPDKWQRLKPATKWSRLGGKRKATKKRGGMRAAARRKASGMKILTRSARLRRSITKRADSNGVEVGTNLIYAATHQFGRTSGKGAPIPERPFLLIQDGDWSKFESILEEHITEAITDER
jgi:phage gpG-like protein